MRISTKGRYALRVMLDLAQHTGQGYISLSDIAKRQDISKNYLDQIMMLLKKDNMFKASRGYQGGYMLARKPAEYTVGEILCVTEGSVAPVACVEEEEAECGRGSTCLARQVWLGLDHVMNHYLNNLTLQDILDMQTEDAGDRLNISLPSIGC